MQLSDFDFQPQMPGYEEHGKEQSLRKLIFMHYSDYFDREQALDLTNKYIAAFLNQSK